MADEIGYFNLPGYSLISSYCRKNKKKNGGYCIYMKSNIVVKPITKFDYLNVDEYFEASIVKLEQFKLIIICIYKNPNSNIKILLDNLEIVLDHFEKANNEIIIICDWNINYLKNNWEKKHMESLLNMYGLKAVIDTRLHNAL